MIFNIAFAFIIPWIFGLYLLKKAPKIIVLISPIASVIAFSIDVVGFQLNYWHVKPFYDTENFSALPFHLGIYPLLGGFFVYFLEKSKLSPRLLIFIFALLATSFEFVAVMLEKVVYGNGWNIFFTFFSYVLPYVLIYWYYKHLKKLNVL